MDRVNEINWKRCFAGVSPSQVDFVPIPTNAMARGLDGKGIDL